MTALRRFLLALVCLLPLITLVHKNDLDRWDVARSAMAAPDEFSYLLLADSFLHGHGVHLHDTIGRDTFYPPGYPLILAAAALPFGRLSTFLPHAVNAALLCLATLLAYLLGKRLLAALAHDRGRFRIPARAVPWIALAAAAVFAADWHVLEGALFVFSEPAFTVVTLLWLLLAMRWQQWPDSWWRTLLIAALAMAAYTIRGAGLVCIAATLLYPLLALSTINLRCRALAVVLVLLLAGLTKYATRYTDLAPNSYPHQLVNGLTHGGQLDFSKPTDWPRLAIRAGDLALSHLDDFAQSFTPIPRVAPDLAPLSIIGRVFAVLALAGWLRQLLARRSATRFVDLYLLFYFALYLLWPFNMPRFWTPILPLMLIYALHAASLCVQSPARPMRWAPLAALLLLLVLNGEELFLQLPPYQRRLNYVSDALADSAAAILRHTPPGQTASLCVAGGDEHFIYAWYLGRLEQTRSGSPESPPRVKIDSPKILPDGKDERIEALIERIGTHADQTPGSRVFVASYFTESLFQEVFNNLRHSDPAFMKAHEPRKIFQKGIETCVWDLTATPPPTATQFPPPP